MNKNPEIQFRSPEEIKAYQESRLAEELLYLQNHSRFYKSKPIRKAGWLRNCFICRIIHDSTNVCSKHIISIYNR